MLIGFLAKRKHGKDTAADYLQDNYNFTKKSFAGPLKLGIQKWFLFTDEQLHTDKKEEIDPRWGISPRKAYQIIGTELVRNTFPNLLFNEMKLNTSFWIKNFDIRYKESTGNIVVSDVRFQNEVDYIRKQGGIVIKIHRPCMDRHTGKKVNICRTITASFWSLFGYVAVDKDSHESEKGIDSITNHDFEIINEDLGDFYGRLDIIMSKKLI